MGEWDGTPQASQFAATATGLSALFQRLERVEKLLRQLTGANILSAADVIATKTGLTIASELLVTGATRIEGTLSLPAGIVDNASLATPIGFAAASNGQTNFSVPTSPTNLAATSLTTPSGFTSAVVLSYVSILAQNPAGAGYDYLHTQSWIGDVDGDSLPFPAEDGDWCPGQMMGLRTIDGLMDGSLIALACRVNAQRHTWSANASARAFVRAIGLFFR